MLLRPLVVASLLVLAGCSSSGGTAASSPTTAGSASSGPASGSAQAATLASTLRRSTADLTSAHITVDAGSLGGTSTGDVEFASGRATASDITLSVGGGTRVVTVGDTSYAKLPAGRGSSGRPWAVVSPGSKNPFVQALVPQVGIIKAASSIPAIADLVATSTSVADKGTTSLGRHYALQLDTDAISGSALGRQLADLGTNPLPVDLYLDPKGRPVQITISAKLGSAPLPIVVTVSRFGEPVGIQAPPSAQVAS